MTDFTCGHGPSLPGRFWVVHALGTAGPCTFGWHDYAKADKCARRWRDYGYNVRTSLSGYSHSAGIIY